MHIWNKEENFFFAAGCAGSHCSRRCGVAGVRKKANIKIPIKAT
jgi:hypothetical protein